MDSGVFLSTNSGADWSPVNDGLMASSIRALAISGIHVFAGTEYRGVWSRPITEMTAIGEIPGPPAAAIMDEPYPNPFNRSTTIGFNNPTTGFVALTVHNVLGQRVAGLVNQITSPGRHAVTFDASGLPSGVYFYRLQIGSFNEVKRLVLVD